MKYAKYTLFSLIILLTVVGLVSFGLEKAVEFNARSFDADKFKTMTYSDEALSLFCDIAFTDGEVCVRKWTTDIRVEIKNIEELDEASIAEVDTIIAILAPLIAPLKMERVRGGGNLHVYRKVKRVNPTKPEPFCLNGMARINKKSLYSWDISFVQVFDGCDASSQTLMHEFEHALGLNHPIKLYPYYVTIGRSVIPQFFRSQDEVKAFMTQPFYISEQEKEVIRMLYSPQVHSGLHINLFAKQMGFSEEDRMEMIPEINKRPRIVIYPSPIQVKL